MLPHVPAAGLAWLRAVGWAGRRRVFGRAEQHEVRIARQDGGCIRGVLQPARGSRAAVLAVGGSTGGLHGPAWIYPELCARLQSAGMTGLRLDYRWPNRLEACTQDVLAGIQFLAEQGIECVVLLGWSFGGAVVIRAGVQSAHVVAVATVGAGPVRIAVQDERSLARNQELAAKTRRASIKRLRQAPADESG